MAIASRAEHMFFKRARRDEPEINLIPLIDVMLVVLIFLVTTTTFARFSEMQINLPEAQADRAQDVPAQIHIAVDEQGGYGIANTRLPANTGVEDLARALTAAAGGQADPVIIIQADARAMHQAVIRVIDAARRAGYVRVTFVTQTPAD